MNASLDDIINFVPLDERLACAGQPSRDQFTLLAREGFEAVINLATEASTGHLPDEAELCRAVGLDFTWQPVDWKAPTLEDYLDFERWLEANRARKALVHCAKNWRASMFCALYRVRREGLGEAQAWEDVREVWEPDDVWTELARRALE